LRRARDLMDREYAEPLDVPATVRAALMSPSHFARQFPAAYGETPYRPPPSERVKAPTRESHNVGISATVVPSRLRLCHEI
jgi:AraC-like DNA-binding protein